jgi:hypothetical protein
MSRSISYGVSPAVPAASWGRVIYIEAGVLAEIALVAADCHNCALSSVIAEEVDPGLQVGEGIGS